MELDGVVISLEGEKAENQSTYTPPKPLLSILVSSRQKFLEEKTRETLRNWSRIAKNCLKLLEN